ncbi:hypothetical protein POVWA2_004820 [Plasmodium ovale wallikeri]|uniref:Uncharacterized protein n=2 Tax=Plasmodium ovale TaxID=36330 RepID=A0A1A8YJ48_PLAOA|nr:hypothetical protein POVWA1_004760 [Plasmodium ovale wallikeri]SBT31559.1 hypothetical protein POVWA2_004820 [Plasmodium ovale wallikeri]SBT75397.1 hypothetical protein POWCR01_030005200 [Plasmodium ovale]
MCKSLNKNNNLNRILRLTTSRILAKHNHGKESRTNIINSNISYSTDYTISPSKGNRKLENKDDYINRNMPKYRTKNKETTKPKKEILNENAKRDVKNRKLNKKHKCSIFNAVQKCTPTCK